MTHKLLLTLSFLSLIHCQFGMAAIDSLEEVNQYRATKGLKPFVRDEKLSKAAAACADYRASRRIEGHADDFRFLPPGANADSAGCGALTPDWGWGTCCMDDNYKYAGAAFTWGTDGQRYMQLFVSNTPNASTYSWKKTDEHGGWWYMKDNDYVGFLKKEGRKFYWRHEDGTYSEPQELKAGEYPKPENLEE